MHTQDTGAASRSASVEKRAHSFWTELWAVTFLFAIAPSVLAVERVHWYETRGVVMHADTLADWSKDSYWSRKLSTQVQLTLVGGGLENSQTREMLLAAVSAWISSSAPSTVRSR